MRVALVAEDYYPQLGGVPEHVHNLALQLNSWGHAATVISSHMGSYPYAAFVRRVGTSRVIYSNGGGSRSTAGRRLRRGLARRLRDGGSDAAPRPRGPAPPLASPALGAAPSPPRAVLAPAHRSP